MTVEHMSMIRGALLSGDHVYRYALKRTWELDAPKLAWVGLNPSIADDKIDDQTIRREIRFSQKWGYGGMIKVNMFGLISTDPKALITAKDPIGPGNDEVLWELTKDLTVIAAWGAGVPIKYDARAHMIANRLRRERATYVLGFNIKDGSPKHPARLRADLDPVRWGPLTVA